MNAKLSAAQEESVQYMLRPESEGAALLAYEVGLGKTRTALMFSRAYTEHVILAVVPLQTVDDWMLEATDNGQTAYWINSTAAGKKALNNFMWRKPGVYVVGQEIWERLAWVKVKVPKRRKEETQKYRKQWSGVWAGGGFLFIYDEAHRGVNPTSWTNTALMSLTPWLEGGPFKVALSGTWMGDRFEGAYGGTRWMWPHRTDIIPAKVKEWRALWAKVEYDHFTYDHEKVTGEKEPGAFVNSLPCYIQLESDLPPAITHDLYMDLYPEQRRVYDELDDAMVAWILGDPLVVEYSITKRARQRQATLAMPTLTFSDDGELLEVSFEDDAESAKIDTLFTEIDGEGELGDLLVGETALILTDSRKFATILTKRLNERYGPDTAREWSGTTAREKGKQKRTVDRPYRKGIKADFIAGNLRFIVGVQAAMGTGTNGLQKATHIVIFMSKTDRRIDNEQGIGRARRMGQKFQVHVINILAWNTRDEGQHSAQMEAALAMQKSMKRKAREEKRLADQARRDAILRG